MEYQVTARKWRPQSFEQVIGQEHVTRALTNAIESGKIPHAFLFSGPRGVGKTTTARILAKSLNCETGISSHPCQKCASCEAITNGHSLDVQEIDGASNRGIDNIREIRDNISYMAIQSRFKIIIIDEVHMLTTEASNALLKTLEEPPEHVFFVLATTEPNKVLPTIRSRCQHYLFKRISISVIVDQLKLICERENVQAEDQGLYQIALAADGSMRDAETLFDQIVLYSNAKITPSAVTDIIGIPEETLYFDVLDAIESGDVVDLLQSVSDYIEKFGDSKLFFRGFLSFLRNGLLVLQIERSKDLLELPEAQIDAYRKHFSKFSIKEVTLLMKMMAEIFGDFRGELNDRFVLELLLFRLMDYRNQIPLAEIRRELHVLSSQTSVSNGEQRVSKGANSQKLKQNSRAKINTPVTQQAISHPISEEQESQKFEPRRVPDLPVWEKDSADILKKVLSKSSLAKPMISQFLKIETTENLIRVFVAKPYHFELLNGKVEQFEKDLQAEVGYDVHLEFVAPQPEEGESFPPSKIKKETGLSKAQTSLSLQDKKGEKTDDSDKSLEDQIKGLFG